MEQQQLDFAPPKTLADHPLITDLYAKKSDHWLAVAHVDMTKRTAKPETPWCPPFAHLHLEAIELEIEKRKPGPAPDRE